MLFNLVEIIPGSSPAPHLAEDGKVWLFSDGKEAAVCAARMSIPPRKFQPRPFIVSEDWRAREAERFTNGAYRLVQWATEPWFLASEHAANHFLHVSTDDPERVAFTENEAHGAADRQTRMRPGRYLERFFAETLSGDEIRDIATRHLATVNAVKLRLAMTADEIEQVYINGPSSCMSGSCSRFDSDVHPSRAYAGGDLAVAYIERDDNITARAVVWPAKKIHSRIYGDTERMRRALHSQEYRESTFVGARLAMIGNDGGGFVMPYLDGCQNLRIENNFFVIVSNGAAHYCADSVSGVIGDDRDYSDCACCGDSVYDDEACAVQEETWCQNCADNHSFMCDYCEEYFHEDYAVNMAGGATWSQAAFDEHGGTCEATGENHPVDNLVELHDGRIWSRDYFEDHGRTCDTCGELMHVDDDCPDCDNVDGAQEELPLPLPTVEPRPGQFVVGQQVCCIDAAGVLSQGTIYTVRGVNGDYLSISLRTSNGLEVMSYGWPKIRFSHVDPDPQS